MSGRWVYEVVDLAVGDVIGVYATNAEASKKIETLLSQEPRLVGDISLSRVWYEEDE